MEWNDVVVLSWRYSIPAQHQQMKSKSFSVTYFVPVHGSSAACDECSPESDGFVDDLRAILHHLMPLGYISIFQFCVTAPCYYYIDGHRTTNATSFFIKPLNPGRPVPRRQIAPSARIEWMSPQEKRLEMFGLIAISVHRAFQQFDIDKIKILCKSPEPPELICYQGI